MFIPLKRLWGLMFSDRSPRWSDIPMMVQCTTVLAHDTPPCMGICPVRPNDESGSGFINEPAPSYLTKPICNLTQKSRKLQEGSYTFLDPGNNQDSSAILTNCLARSS